MPGDELVINPGGRQRGLRQSRHLLIRSGPGSLNSTRAAAATTVTFPGGGTAKVATAEAEFDAVLAEHQRPEVGDGQLDGPGARSRSGPGGFTRSRPVTCWSCPRPEPR